MNLASLKKKFDAVEAEIKNHVKYVNRSRMRANKITKKHKEMESELYVISKQIENFEKIWDMDWAKCTHFEGKYPVVKVNTGVSLKKAVKIVIKAMKHDYEFGVFTYLMFNDVLLVIERYSEYDDIEKEYEREIAEKHMVK